MEGSLLTKLQQQAQILKPLCVHAVAFSVGWVRGCVRIMALYFIHVYIIMWRWVKTVFLTMAVLPLAIKHTVVAKWRSPVDGFRALGGLTVQAHYLSGYSHCPPPRPPAQLSLH